MGRKTDCERYSTACGADAWLQFDASDPPEYQALNGKCVVVLSTEGDTKQTDEDDPLHPGQLLKVTSGKLRVEDPSGDARGETEIVGFNLCPDTLR